MKRGLNNEYGAVDCSTSVIWGEPNQRFRSINLPPALPDAPLVTDLILPCDQRVKPGLSSVVRESVPATKMRLPVRVLAPLVNGR
jgi:hypothetical protein